MDLSRICYGCFCEKGTEVCPYCGFSAKDYDKPVLALPLGTILNGRYITGRVLGQGGFGITYLGYDLTLDIKVAIKEYLPQGLVGRTEDAATVTLISRRDEESFRTGTERFLDEARTLAKLQNVPGIVWVQNFFQENNTAYFVMEYVEGTSLKDFAASQGGTLSYEQTAHILLPVMEALVGVHEKSLLHRDISPDNIYITSDGQSKLLDFGAARYTLGGHRSMSVILKHGYAPEEQYSAHGNQGPWTDVYAMGATFYNCLTGALPPDSIERARNDSLRSPAELGVKLPRSADNAIMKALSVDANERFQSMTDFIRALSSTAPQLQRTVAAGSAPVKKGLSKKVAAVIAAAAVLIAAVVVIVIVSGRGGDTQTGTGTDTPTATDTPTETDSPDVTATPTPSDGQEAHTSAALNCTITVPEGWTLDSSTEDQGSMTISKNANLAIGVLHFNGTDKAKLIAEKQTLLDSMATGVSSGATATVNGEYDLQLAGRDCHMVEGIISENGGERGRIWLYMYDGDYSDSYTVALAQGSSEYSDASGLEQGKEAVRSFYIGTKPVSEDLGDVMLYTDVQLGKTLTFEYYLSCYAVQKGEGDDYAVYLMPDSTLSNNTAAVSILATDVLDDAVSASKEALSSAYPDISFDSDGAATVGGLSVRKVTATVTAQGTTWLMERYFRVVNGFTMCITATRPSTAEDNLTPYVELAVSTFDIE